jgi:hypothetical protein
MKSLMYPTIHKCRYLLMAVFALLVFTGCEGLDDWSDLEGIDLFGSNDDANSEAAIFKRYTEPGNSTAPLVEFIVDEGSKPSRICHQEIRKTCDYTKLPFRSVSLKKWNAARTYAASTRVIYIYDIKKVSDASISTLTDFVARGGTLVIANANEDKRAAYLLGFKPEAEYATDAKAKGWFFSTPFLPGMKGKTYSADMGFFGFDAKNFSSKIKVLMTAANNPKYPAVIENPIGKGRVVFYNTSSEFVKADRGFLFAGVLKGLEGVPYPIANTSTIFLDDFPSPQYEMKIEPVASELNVNMADFVNNIWWPDMKKIAKEFKIPYAAMTTFDYRNKIVPPFTLDQWNAEKITVANKTEPLTDWLVRDCAKNGHELAFHGYNHVSLMKNLWKNQQFISTSMATVKKKWEISNFGDLPVTYVPPSNEIDKMGVIELKKAMPSLKYMCSLFLGDIADGGGREFDYDPYEKNFFDYPRVSSGFYLNDDRKYNVQSTYLFTGIWTHFVHPDDIFQIPEKNTPKNEIDDLRNGEKLGWYKTKGKDKAMYPEFRSILKGMTNTYPQLRFMTVNDAAKEVIDWRASRYTHKSENGYFVISENNPGEVTKQYWFLYASAANADRIEARLKTQVALYSKTPFMDGYLYSAYTNKPRLSLLDMDYRGPKQKAIESNAAMLVRADVARYKEAVKKFVTGAVWVDDSEAKLKLEIANLKIKMLATPAIDSVTWNKYAKYLSWDKKEDEVWKMLEEHVAKYPTKNNVMYSKELDRIIGYPNDLVKEKWMSAQLLVTPNDKDLLNSYVANFYTDENQEKIKNALKALLSVDTSKQSYLNYIKHLLQYKPDEARMELDKKKPTDELAEVATDIVWLYANNNEYQKAYDWSQYSNEIDFLTKMNWLVNLGQKKLLEKEYREYIAEHPDDDKAKVFMASIFHEQGRFKEAWVLTNSLPPSDEKEDMRKTLNKDVLYEDKELQKDLVANHSELFYPDVMAGLIKEDRKKYGSYLNLLSSLETNQKNNAVQKNELSYNRFDKKYRMHSVSVNYSQYYRLPFVEDFGDNYATDLMGLEYKITTAERDGKPQYWARARAEVDKKSKFYYEAGIGFSSAKEKRYRSGELNLFPVETAPGVNQGIYQVRLNLYQDFYLFKYINTSISIEGDYYTSGLLSLDTIKNPIIFNPEKPNPEARPMHRKEYTKLDNETYTVSDFDDSYAAAATVRFMLDNGEEKRMKFIPFLEAQYSFGSRDLPVGYPYWMIKSRMYEGGGLGWKLKLTNFETRLEGSYFFDDFAKNFQRYSGNLSYQLFDYTAITIGAEVFSQKKYYSNSVNVGIKYNLKKKIRKSN